MKRGTKYGILGTAAVAGLLGLATPATAGDADWYFFARWEMNEHTNQTILRDKSGNGFAGTIGARVTPTKQRYHHFPKEDRQKVFPKHVDRVPDNDVLDPGFADFAVSVKFRWGPKGGWGSKRQDMNLVQKGQGSPAGGMFKVKTSVPAAGQPAGHIKCLFRGSSGDSQVESYAGDRLDDGKWHVVRCERDIAGTQMFVDGVLIDTNDNQAGEISNDWPVAIGGNTVCADTATENNQCNYWWGDIGFVRFSKD